MPRPLPPIPPLSPDHEAAAPIAADLDARDLFNDAARPERWTLPLLQLKQAQVLTRAQLCLIQRHAIAALRYETVPKQWALLAASDTLGQVDVGRLTLACLAGLLQHTESLYLNILAGSIRDAATLATRLQARKTQLTSACPGSGAVYMILLDRVADKLRPLLR
jgi:hypothetical protein